MRRLLFAFLLLAGGPAPAAEPLRLITIGTGAANGTYYPVGRALCRMLDRALSAEGIRCSAETTPGSVYNASMLGKGELDFALVQSDVQFRALHGQGHWQGQALPELRSVISLYPEVFTIIAGAESGVSDLETLRGKQLNSGSPGSGSRATWHALAAMLDWKGAAAVREFGATDGVADSLCAGRLDAAAAVGFQPSTALRAQLMRCGNRLVPVEGAAVDKLLANNPFYRRAVIPAVTYAMPKDVPSFAATSDLVTTTRTPPAIVAAVARAIGEHAAELTGGSPALAHFDVRNGSIGLTLQQHPAATEAFRKLGLVR